MKKQFYLMVFCTLLVVGCDKKNDPVLPGKDPGSALFFSASSEYGEIGLLHNHAVDAIIEEFMMVRGDLDGDTLAILHFIQDLSLKYIHDNNIDGSPIDTSLGRLTSAQLLDLMRLHLSGIENNTYYSRFIELAEKTTLHDINEVLADIETDISAEEDEDYKAVLFTSTAIGKASAQYWYDRSLVDPTIPANKWTSYAMTDLLSGLEGGVWGFGVGGPIGAVAVGVNAAIIGSSMSFLIDRMFP